MKKIIGCIVILIFIILVAINVNLGLKGESAMFSSLSLKNIEALAQTEDNCHWYNYGREAETVRCQNDLGSGWYNWSVKRVCNVTPDASKTCTPVKCGGAF